MYISPVHRIQPVLINTKYITYKLYLYDKIFEQTITMIIWAGIIKIQARYTDESNGPRFGI